VTRIKGRYSPAKEVEVTHHAVTSNGEAENTNFDSKTTDSVSCENKSDFKLLHSSMGCYSLRLYQKNFTVTFASSDAQST
jgi:hypothetical protein